MKKLKLKSNPEVEKVFKSYPRQVQKKLSHLRDLILKSAVETEEITEIEETLKWGEPSYLVAKGSTVRIDWKEKTPDQYAMYFKCTSKLVQTFRKVYGSVFKFEGDRAIIFKFNDEIPEAELKNCIKTALRYHKVKLLPELVITKGFIA